MLSHKFLDIQCPTLGRSRSVPYGGVLGGLKNMRELVAQHTSLCVFAALDSAHPWQSGETQ